MRTVREKGKEMVDPTRRVISAGRDSQVEEDGRHHGRERDAVLQQDSVKRQVTVSTRVVPRREEFVPHSDEEMEEWMAGRHADLHTAMVSGQIPEVARISQLMTNAAQEWHRLIQGQMTAPSVVANTVR